MKKTLLYRLFGIGKIPAPYVEALKSEGIVLSDEGIKGTMTLRNFRAPGRYSNWKRRWGTTSIALSNTRLLAFLYAAKTIDVPLADERFRQIQFSIENENTLLAAFDASVFNADASGQIECRFTTPLAHAFLEKLKTCQNA